MYCKNCGTEIKLEEQYCYGCGSKNPDIKIKSDSKLKKRRTIIISIIIVLIISLISSSIIKEIQHNNKIKQVTEEQTKLYKDKLIPALVGDFNDYTVNNITCKEISPQGQCDYAIQIDCELTISDYKKFNYPLIALFNNDENNPKYQNSEQATKDITDTIKIKKEENKKANRLAERVNLSAKDLISNYKKNEVSANEWYTGKTGIITGKIKSIDVHGGTPCIVLSNGDNNSVTNVNCYFKDNDQSDKIATLKKGKNVTIKGSIRGLALVDVCLDDCIIQ